MYLVSKNKHLSQLNSRGKEPQSEIKPSSSIFHTCCIPFILAQHCCDIIEIKDIKGKGELHKCWIFPQF